MGFTFKKATKAQAKLRLALIGPSGSGKTFSALSIATNLGERVAVIDTERGSASKYADKFSFDACEMESFEPASYVAAIHAAEEAGFDVIVVDSLSHAWMGKGGALEMVDNAQRRQRTPNSFTAWRDVTPEHNRLVEAIVTCRAHIIVTMRAKTEYVQDKDDRGKTVIRKIGLAPVQRDGLEYEFDVVGDIDLDNILVVSKTRCSELAERTFKKPGKDVADLLRAWLSDGTTPLLRPASEPERPATVSVAATPTFVNLGARIEQADSLAEVDAAMADAMASYRGKAITAADGKLLRELSDRRREYLASVANEEAEKAEKAFGDEAAA